MISNLENTKKGNKSAKNKSYCFLTVLIGFFCVLTDQVYSTYDINYFEEEKEKDVKRKQFKLTQALAVLAIRQIFKRI